MKKVWTKTFNVLLAVIILLTVSVFSVPAVSSENVVQGDFFVAPNGNDSNNGSEQAPFKTIRRAKEAVRSKNAGGQTSDITVVIRAGRYFQSETLLFDENDGGQGGHNVIYKAYPGEQPEIIGGKELKDWILDTPIDRADAVESETAEGIWGAILSFFERIGIVKNAASSKKIETGIYKIKLDSEVYVGGLFENDNYGQLARTPNDGYFRVESAENLGTIPCFSFKQADVPYEFDYSDAGICIWGGAIGTLNNDWYPDFMPITNIDWETRKITLKEATMWTVATTNRYYLRGAKEFLDAPGEYFYDKYQGILYYYPVNANIKAQSIILPTLDRIVGIKGSDKSNPVKNLTFDGIKFFGTSQQETFTSTSQFEDLSMIHLENTEYITIQNCMISNAGHTGVAFKNYSKYTMFTGNVVRNIALHGLFIGSNGFTFGNFRNLEEAYENKGHTISNNVISHIGCFNGMGAGVSIQGSGENKVIHNTIYDGARYGISMKSMMAPNYESVGGILYGEKVVPYENHWDFNFNRDNLIAWNDISDCMNDGSDGGSIEMFGSGKGNIIEYNYVHDSIGISSGINVGIYLDDGSDYTIVRHNVVARIKGSMITTAMNIKGIHNEVYNNIMYDIKPGTVFLCVETPVSAFAGSAGGWMPSEPNRNRWLTFKNNIVYYPDSANSSTDIIEDMGWHDDKYLEFDYNIYYGKNIKWNMKDIDGIPTLTEWKQSGYDTHSIHDDPLFADAENGNFKFSADSPAVGLGFKELDVSQCGVSSETSYMLAPDRITVRETDKTVTLLWPESGEYVVRYGTKSGEYTKEVLVSGSEANVKKLKNGVRYFFRLIPAGDAGRPVASEEFSAVPGEIVFKDTFDYYREGEQPDDWSVTVGQAGFGIDKALTTLQTGTVICEKANQENYTVSASVKVDAWSSYGNRQMGLVARYTDEKNYYRMDYTYKDKMIRLKKVKDGEVYELLSVPFEMIEKQPVTMSLRCKGSMLEVFLNGESSGKCKDNALKSGKAGVISDQNVAVFDDFVIER